MPQTQIDCCNSALQRVGATTITSLTDNSPEARACVVAYDSNRRSELRKYNWNFAVTRVILTPDTVAPLFDYEYAFTLPTDCLRVLRPNDVDLDWKIEGRKILSNDGATLNLRYVADVTNEALFDSTFYDVVSAALAVDLCERLTQSNTKKQLLMAEYKDLVNMARRVNAIETGPQVAPDDAWWTVRL